ncbi:glycosyltransferase family 2 protein [Terriglobus sp.]|uniref:glycosyltransferase family 2 protein n=1 Tax=Terriglobus sp. TaxID=1889013 RepID=UPI003B00B987
MAEPVIDVSITIATCCRAAMLCDLLAHLLPQAEAVPFRTEFVIVDDGSTDCTPGILLAFQQYARVPVIIVRGEGTGIAAARNLAVAHSNGTWLACCDDDQITAPDWLYSLYEAALQTSADFAGGSMRLHLPATFQSSTVPAPVVCLANSASSANREAYPRARTLQPITC